ncbi:uncharacterized protein IAS62_001285 [Cryptococcus decagattii]|uniref:Uncharacterized protein n=1 Tax=Cryptococcus decagattii TaxID=1859122 RepID=A0ABZ2ATW6_9TREE
MYTAAFLRSTVTGLRPALHRQAGAACDSSQTLLTSSRLGGVAKRFNSTSPGPRSDKPKLVFRFGLRDIPVELYPILFVTGAACVGGGVALGRQIYLGDLRFKPTGPASAQGQH